MKLLLAEDNFLAAYGIARMVEQIGYHVIGPVATQAQALAVLEEFAPSVALIDFSLRDGNCVELALTLREKSIPFAFITGYSTLPDLPQVLQDSTLLHKPFDKIDLERLLKKIK